MSLMPSINVVELALVGKLESNRVLDGVVKTSKDLVESILEYLKNSTFRNKSGLCGGV